VLGFRVLGSAERAEKTPPLSHLSEGGMLAAVPGQIGSTTSTSSPSRTSCARFRVLGFRALGC
jgi:hypothetical protein